MSRFLDDETITELRRIEDTMSPEQWRKAMKALPVVKPVILQLVQVALSGMTPYQKALVESIGRRWAGGGML